MRKVSVLLFFALFACVCAQAARIHGRVISEGAPLSGVIVSDGYGFTTTDAKGRYSISANADARFVFVITPSGYVADCSSGVPEFYISLASKRKSYDFELGRMPHAESTDYALFSVSDPQMKTKAHFKRFCGHPLADLAEMARREGALRQTAGVSLGDIAWNKLEMFDSYKKAIPQAGIPFYSVIGNHDFIQNKGGIEAGSAFEAAFGPYNHAFFLGSDLVICVNNIIFRGSDNPDPGVTGKYDEGYSEETLGFVRGLLALVDPSVHIYIAQHSPLYRWWREPIIGGDTMLAMLNGRSVDFLSGHTHIRNIHHYGPSDYAGLETGKITEFNAASICGAWWSTDVCNDGTPRGYDIFTDIDGVRSRFWHNIDYPDDYLVEFIAPGTSPEFPESIVVNAWDADENWTVTWSEDGTPKGEAEQVLGTSPIYVKQILPVFDGDLERIPRFKKPRKNNHYYRITPSEGASKVVVSVAAPDGRSWSKSFSLR